MSKNKDVKRGIVLYIDGKQVKDDVSSIKAEIRKLKKEMEHMSFGSKEYKESADKLRTLNSMIKEHNKLTRQTNEEHKKFNIGKVVDGFNRYAGVIATVTASLTGLVLGFRSLRKERAKLESSQAGLKALTGLDDKSIDWLTERSKKLSTTVTKDGLRVRQSAEEILDAFTLVGSAQPVLLKNKDALASVTEEAMRLQASAKKIDLKTSADALTLSMNQFNAEAKEAARYVNVLAAGSKEGSADIASQAAAIQRAGVAAAGANVSIEETVGLIETLAEKGIKNEVAGTALRKFFLVLQTGADETNPAIVGLSKALQNLEDKQLSAAGIKKMFGEEGFNAASVILQNTDRVKHFTEAVTDSNIAFEQSAINSNTAEARLAQVINKMKLAGIELAERLNPAFVVSTNAMTYVIKILPGLIDWFMKWGTVIVAAAANMAVLVLWQQKNVIWTKIQTFWNDKLVASFKKLWVAIKANPWTALISVITLAGAALYDYFRAMNKVTAAHKSLNSIQKKTDEEFNEQASKIKTLNSILHNNKLSIDKRREALEELKKIIPDYNASLSDEGVLTRDNTQAIDEYLVSLEKEIKLKAAREELENLYRKERETQKELNKANKEYDTAVADKNAPNFGGAAAAETAQFGQSQTLIRASHQVKVVKNNLLSIREAIKAVNEEIAEGSAITGGTTKRANPILPTNSTGDNSNKDDKKKVLTQQEIINQKIEEIEKEHKAKMIHLEHLYLEGKFESDEEYANMQIQQEIDTLNEKLLIAGMEPEQIEKIQVEILKAKKKFNDECKEEDDKKAKDDLKRAEAYKQLTLNLADQFAQNMGEMVANGELTMKNFLKQTLTMALDALERIIEITSLEITAKEIAAHTPFNWIGAAKAAAKIAAIKAAFAVVKGFVSNFYTGGFTPQGEWNQPQGVVHSNEFVANRYAVANPAVMPVLQLIDTAQKNGSVANLTGAEIANVASGGAGGGAINSLRQDNALMAASLAKLTKVVDKLNSRLNEPIIAEATISGRNGIKQKMDEYNKLISNKSRQL